MQSSTGPPGDWGRRASAMSHTILPMHTQSEHTTAKGSKWQTGQTDLSALIYCEGTGLQRTPATCTWEISLTCKPRFSPSIVTRVPPSRGPVKGLICGRGDQSLISYWYLITLTQTWMDCKCKWWGYVWLSTLTMCGWLQRRLCRPWCIQFWSGEGQCWRRRHFLVSVHHPHSKAGGALRHCPQLERCASHL